MRRPRLTIEQASNSILSSRRQPITWPGCWQSKEANLDVALSYAQTAREQKPDDPNIADTLGWIYYKKNAYLLAVNLLKEAADKLPNEPVVQFHYGMAQYKNGNAAGARTALQTSLKLSKDFTGSEEAQKNAGRPMRKGENQKKGVACLSMLRQTCLKACSRHASASPTRRPPRSKKQRGQSRFRAGLASPCSMSLMKSY